MFVVVIALVLVVRMMMIRRVRAALLAGSLGVAIVLVRVVVVTPWPVSVVVHRLEAFLGKTADGPRTSPWQALGLDEPLLDVAIIPWRLPMRSGLRRRAGNDSGRESGLEGPWAFVA